jgi:hypothetical protein
MCDEPTVATNLLPYEAITDRSFSDAEFTISPAGLSVLVLSGRCPRCTAQIEIPVLDPLLGGSRAGPGERGIDWMQADAEADLVPVLCTCLDPHPGRPDGAIGCGAYWDFHFPVE